MLLRQLLLTCVWLFTIVSSTAQENLWSPADYKDLNYNKSSDSNFTLSDKNYFFLDITSLMNELGSAPNRGESMKSNLNLNIPNHKGDMVSYEVFKTETLPPQLAQKFPEINSYVGKSLNNSAGILRLTTTSRGIYIMITEPNIGQFFINPIDETGQYYESFLKSNAQDFNRPNCEFNSLNSNRHKTPYKASHKINVDDGFLRVYDLALACTGEYSQFQIDQAGLDDATESEKISAVLSGMVVTLDRVNAIYERDLGVSMQLIPDTDVLIFLDPENDPYSNHSASSMLSENQSIVDAMIGSENYDIGHVFGTGDGGIAILGSVCNNGIKAKGVTGSLAPVGDPFNIDYVAHEMGHQFGANHTQNNGCQRNPATAVEPGSASTIMGYAGICEPNIQINSDAYFHHVSIDEIFNNIISPFGSNCGELVEQINNPPILNALPTYTIPYGTAFYLDVEAVDNEDDILSYNWEQTDNEVSPQPPLSNFTQGPNFRSLPSKTDSRRYFPNFNSVLNNNLSPTWEVIPNVARTMGFSVTVRDNNLQVGQSSSELTSVIFADAGPFQVTSQNTDGINWLPGETKAIMWEIAGTTSNGINTSHVNILLSTDGGDNFDIVLASNTPNDGLEEITVPSLKSPSCRIMVAPVDNIYYALNATEFSIDTLVDCEGYTNTVPLAIPDGIGQNQPETPVESIINITDELTNIDDINIRIDISHTWINDLFIQLKNPSGDNITLWERNCNSESGINITFNDNGSTLASPNSDCADPLTGNFAPTDTTTDLASLFSSGTSGDWVLEISDFWNKDTGVLNSWEIEICTSTFSIQDSNIDDFTIIPNPNDGTFNLSLNQPLNEDSRVSIYDMQGRLIEIVDYALNALSQRIVLKNKYQSGVYLLEILDQNKKSVEKLIIN